MNNFKYDSTYPPSEDGHMVIETRVELLSQFFGVWEYRHKVHSLRQMLRTVQNIKNQL